MDFAIRKLLTLAAGLSLFLAGCSREPTVDLVPQSVPPDKTVVTVNGEPLSLEEFDNEFRLMQIHYSAVTEGDMRAIKRRLFEQVINRRLLVQEARRIGLKMTQSEVDGAFQDALKDMPDDFWAVLKVRGISPDVWKRKMLQEKMASKVVDLEVNSKVQITPQEVEDYYWTHLSNYWRPQAVRARHLVVQKRGDLQKALESLKKGEDFPKITSTFSVGPEKSQGGDWGFMDSDRLPKEYLQALSGLKPGEISKPLKDNFGYHLFQLIEWRDRQMRPFAEVKDQIHDDLMKEEQDHRFDQWMTDLKKKSVIKVNKDLAPVIGVTLEDLREE
ncbi:MAG TPA: peptidyl-prolyl cis-trans isomerase [bacterium]|nr:peptidyl-prolyl cis-trans isomerase [bacterium]